MEEYKVFITTFVIAILIPTFYMMAYVLKGKEKGVLAFFKTLLGTLGMYFSSLVPIMFMVMLFTEIDRNDLVAVCVMDICSIIFSAPFFSELIKRIANDFEVPDGFESHFHSLILVIVAIFFVGSLTIVFTAGYIAGEVSIFAVFAMLLMLAVMITIIVISRQKSNAAGEFEKLEEIKKIERKIGIGLSVVMLLFFVLLMIFGN